jgi:hypothetical protein
MLPNILIKFPRSSETYEYDILIPLEQNKILNVEVTDYSSATEIVKVNNSSLKQELILSTMDKASVIKAKAIVIIKGFESNTFEQMKNIASARNIILLDDKDYLNTIQEIILRYSIPNIESYYYSYPFIRYNLTPPSISTSAYLDMLKKYIDSETFGEPP